MNENLKVRIKAGPMSGSVYHPAGEGPWPGVLLLHGSSGGWVGWNDQKALMLAVHGFAAYAFPYSRNGNAWNAGDIVDVELERTEQALRAFRELPEVGPKVGLYGISRGGEHALLITSLLAAEGSPALPDALAAHAPADVVIGAFRAAWWRNDQDREPWDPAALSWLWRGKRDGLMPGTPIEIERYTGPVFMSHGEKDLMWTAEMTRRLEARLRAAGRDPEVHYYEDQGHGFDPETANIQWERLIAFFRRHLVD